MGTLWRGIRSRRRGSSLASKSPFLLLCAKIDFRNKTVLQTYRFYMVIF